MTLDPTVSPPCTCPWVDGLRHYDPTCYEHGEWPELEAPKRFDLLGIDPDEKWYCGRGPCGRMGDHEGECG